MNKSTKKILSFVLALSMMFVVLSGFTTTANADFNASSATKVSDSITVHLDCGALVKLTASYLYSEADEVYEYYRSSHSITHKPANTHITVKHEKVSDSEIVFTISVTGNGYDEVQIRSAYCGSQSGEIEWFEGYL